MRLTHRTREEWMIELQRHSFAMQAISATWVRLGNDRHPKDLTDQAVLQLLRVWALLLATEDVAENPRTEIHVEQNHAKVRDLLRHPERLEVVRFVAQDVVPKGADHMERQGRVAHRVAARAFLELEAGA